MAIPYLNPNAGYVDPGSNGSLIDPEGSAYVGYGNAEALQAVSAIQVDPSGTFRVDLLDYGLTPFAGACIRFSLGAYPLVYNRVNIATGNPTVDQILYNLGQSPQSDTADFLYYSTNLVGEVANLPYYIYYADASDHALRARNYYGNAAQFFAGSASNYISYASISAANVATYLAISEYNALAQTLNQQAIVQDPIGNALAAYQLIYTTALAVAATAQALALAAVAGALISVNYYYGIAYNAEQQYETLARGIAASTTATLLAAANAAPGTIAAYQQQATNAINGIVATANAVKASTVDPTVASGLATLLGAVATVQAQAAALQTQINNAAASTKATVDQQAAAAQAEVNNRSAAAQQQAGQQRDAALANANAALATAMGAVATATALAGSTAASAVATATAQANNAIALATGTLNATLAQLADRPLYYGALTTPITITNTTDVIVIPPGGLTLTAD